MNAGLERNSNGIPAWLYEEICQAQETGVPVMVNGTFYSLESAGNDRDVMESHCYMKSYVADREGKVLRVDFDYIDGVFTEGKV